MFVKEGVVFTADRGVLEGVTRKSVFLGCKKARGGGAVRGSPVEMAWRCDECFVCTTAGGVMPITRIDGSPVGKGTVGEVTGRIWDGYWGMHWEEGFRFAVDYSEVGAGCLDSTEAAV